MNQRCRTRRLFKPTASEIPGWFGLLIDAAFGACGVSRRGGSRLELNVTPATASALLDAKCFTALAISICSKTASDTR